MELQILGINIDENYEASHTYLGVSCFWFAKNLSRMDFGWTNGPRKYPPKGQIRSKLCYELAATSIAKANGIGYIMVQVSILHIPTKFEEE